MWTLLSIFLGGVILTPTPVTDPSGAPRFPPASPWSPVTLMIQGSDMKESPWVRIFAPETALALERAEQQILHGVSLTAGGFAIAVCGVPYMKLMMMYGLVSTLHSAVSFPYERPGPGLLKLVSWWYSASAGHSTMIHSPPDAPPLYHTPQMSPLPQPDYGLPGPFLQNTGGPQRPQLLDHNIVVSNPSPESVSSSFLASLPLVPVS